MFLTGIHLPWSNHTRKVCIFVSQNKAESSSTTLLVSVSKSEMFHLTTAMVYHFQKSKCFGFGPNQISSDLIKKAFAKVLAIPSTALSFNCWRLGAFDQVIKSSWELGYRSGCVLKHFPFPFALFSNPTESTSSCSLFAYHLLWVTCLLFGKQWTSWLFVAFQNHNCWF